MREIKFRVWCEFTIDDKKYAEMAGTENWFLLTQTGHLMSHGPMSFDPNIEKKHDKLVVEFFTGLKDKNGKEIFEGDIIKAVDSNWWDGIVRWHSEGSIGWGVEPLDKCRGWYGLNTNYGFEIIGTIHDQEQE